MLLFDVTGLTDAEKRAVAPVNVRGAVTFVTSDRSRGQAVKQNAQLRGHTLAYVSVLTRTSVAV